MTSTEERVAALEARFEAISSQLKRIEHAVENNADEVRTIAKQSAWVRGGIVFAIAIGGIVAWVPNTINAVVQLFTKGQ